MPRGGKQPGAGRPQKKITPEELEKAGQAALIGANNNIIEGMMGWCEGFINKKKEISKFLLKKRQEHKMSILQAQQNMKNNPTMAIWLGKQHLGQADKQDQHHTFEEIKVAI